MNGPVVINQKIMVICMGLCLCVTSAYAADYYVSPSGSKPWPTCTTPDNHCNLQVAANNAIVGDTVLLRGGTYVLPVKLGTNWEAGLMPANSGVEGNPITFKAYADEIPFLDNSANHVEPAVASFGTNGQDYIVFDGLHTLISVGNGLGRGCQLHGTTGSVVKNCDIEGVAAGIGNINGVRIEKASHCIVSNNKLYGNHGGAPNGSGITSYSGSYTQAYNNDIYDNSTGLYDKGGGEHNNYYHNFFYANHASGVRIGTEAGPDPHDIEVHHNIFLDNGWDSIEQYPSKKPVTRIHAYNNTIYNSGSVAIAFFSAIFSKTQYTSYNNLISNSGSLVRFDPGIVDYSDYNTYPSSGTYRLGDAIYSSLSAWQSATSYDNNSHTSDPGFVNPGGTSREDYKRTSYPQDGRGGSYPSVRGAYITGNEVIGYSSDGGKPLPPPDIVEPQDFRREPSQ